MFGLGLACLLGPTPEERLAAEPQDDIQFWQNLLTQAAKGWKVSQRPSQPVELRVRLDPDGTFCFYDPASQASALTASRERGMQLAAKILKGEEMLSADQFGVLIGASRETVNEKRKRNQILGLSGTTRGYRYPNWQIDRDGKPFAVLPKLFALLGGNSWTVYRFLVQHHAELDGKSAREVLISGETESVLNAAEGAANGFG